MADQMAYPDVLAAALVDPDIGGVGPIQPTTYGNYSTLFPEPILCFREMLTTLFREIHIRLPWNGVRQWMYETWTWHYLGAYIGLREVGYVLAIALTLTVARYVANKTILERIPKHFKVKKSDADKFPESTWRAINYTLLWCFSVWVIFNEDFLYRPLSLWEDWGIGVMVKPSVYWLYMVEIGHYLHSIYAIVYMETIKKDFWVMFGHHLVTLSLLTYSYALRFVNIGVLVLFLHDFADIWLESAKSVLYFKTRNGVNHSLPEHIANVSFVIFTLQWMFLRLYWYPTKALYALHVAAFYYPGAPYLLSFSFLLWVLFFMHVYWFAFIMKLVYKVLAGNKLDDNREYCHDNSDDDSSRPDGITDREE